MPASCRTVPKPLLIWCVRQGRRKGAWTNLFISSEQVANIIAVDRVQGAALTGSEKAGSVVAAQAAEAHQKSTQAGR